jgi:hypothetical protein
MGMLHGHVAPTTMLAGGELSAGGAAAPHLAMQVSARATNLQSLAFD